MPRIQSGLLEGLPLEPVRQRKLGRQQDVLFVDRQPALPCGVRPRRLQDDDVGPVPVDLEGRGQLGDCEKVALRVSDVGQARPRLRDLVRQLVVARLRTSSPLFWFGLPAAHDALLLHE